MAFPTTPLALALGRSGPEILFYGTGIVLLLAATLLLPHRGGRTLRFMERAAATLARRRGLALLCVAFMGGGIAAGIAAFAGMPMPKVDDEFAYLLAADTFNHGRLANPQLPHWEHFETFHVLQQPVYASKYPPGQGLLLALGQALWHPVLGVWLGTAAAAGAVGWMLMAWLPARWAVLGALLAAMHPEVVTWGQRYWGGCLAMTGGALAIGGWRRAIPSCGQKRAMRPHRPRPLDAAIMGTGIAILAMTRPYEGGVLTLLLGISLLVPIARGKLPLRDFLLRFAAPAAVVLAIAGGWLAYYNARITGSPLRMPYQIHVAQYMAAPIFLRQPAPPLPAYRHADMRDFHTGWEYSGYARQLTGAGLATGLLERTWRLLRGELRQWFLALGFVALPWALRHDRWMKAALSLTWLLFAGLLLVNWTFFHYAAPVFCLFFFCAIQCMRHLRLWRWRGKRTGLFLSRVAFLLCAVSVLHTASEIARLHPDWWWARRTEILDRLHAAGGRHLILIRYAPGIVNAPGYGYRDWTRNEADIESSHVIWARAMDEERDRSLIEHHAGRRTWLLEVEPKAVKLSPWPG